MLGFRSMNRIRPTLVGLTLFGISLSAVAWSTWALLDYLVPPG